MPELSEYEITEPNGTTTTLMLSEADVKRFPNARKVAATQARTADVDSAADARPGRRQEPVRNRARR